jgi:hypothetical protein
MPATANILHNEYSNYNSTYRYSYIYATVVLQNKRSQRMKSHKSNIFFPSSLEFLLCKPTQQSPSSSPHLKSASKKFSLKQAQLIEIGQN